MTKSFTAKQMHNAPGPVFRAADRDGLVQITHDHYKDRVFVLVAEDKPDGRINLESGSCIKFDYASDPTGCLASLSSRFPFEGVASGTDIGSEINDGDKITIRGVRKDLLRKFDDAYNEHLRCMADQMAIAAPKIWTIDKED